QGDGRWVNMVDSVRSALDLKNIPQNMDGNKFRVVYTGDCVTGSLLTSTAALTVYNAPVIGGQPVNISSCIGDDAEINVGVVGDNILYQWQTDNGVGIWSDVNGQTTSVLKLNDIELSQNLFKYRVYLTVPGGTCSLTSDESVLNVSYPPVANAGPDQYVTY